MIRIQTRSIAFYSTLAAAGLSLAACGGGGGSSSSSAAESPAMPGGGGAAECSDASLTTAATEATSTGGFGMLMTGEPVPAGSAFDSYQSSNCQDGWALVGANVTPPGGQLTGAVFLFEAEGQFWVPKTVSEACSSGVPDALKAAACQFVK